MIATVTHARVRAAQGDVAGALRILQTVLDSSPQDADALRLRSELASREVDRPREKAARRLREWIARVREHRRARP